LGDFRNIKRFGKQRRIRVFAQLTEIEVLAMKKEDLGLKTLGFGKLKWHP